MGKGCMKENNNIYFQARKKASEYNDRLSSRETASELLGVSISSLSDYELGNTKVVPVDKVVLMADLYRCPELKTRYCKYECPIGMSMPLATEVKGVEGTALRLLKELDTEKLKEMKSDLIDITADGKITEEEKPELQEILQKLDDMAFVISEMKLIGEKVLKGNS